MERWVLKQRLALAAVPPPKFISFQKWAEGQSPGGRLHPQQQQLGGELFFWKGHPVRFWPGSSVSWSPSFEQGEQSLCIALNLPGSHELCLGSLERGGLRVPRDFSHSVVKQLFPEACSPHTHTRLEIAACPSPYSLCFQRHSSLRPAFPSRSFFFLVNKEPGSSVPLVTTDLQNTATLGSGAVIKCSGCESGKEPTFDA